MVPILSVRKLSTGYGKKQVLFDVSLDVMPSEILLVTGGNGSGKSTMLKTIYGLLPAWNADAEIVFRPNGSPLRTEPANLNLSKGLAYLPQKNAVFDDLTVEENLQLAGHTLHHRQEFAARRDAVLALLPSLTQLLRRKPEKMSGGERQMTALAIVLLHQPKLVLLDEPTAGLAEHLAVEIVQTIKRLQQSLGFAVVVVEHRVGLVESIANRVASLRLGHLQNIAANERKPLVTK
jgi:branched-chain amino acid transport system ATP-binding protein